MKKILSLVLTLTMLASFAAIPAMAEDTYREPITLTMFSELANYAGEQQGWFGKELKDRFNVTLKYVSSNVDSNAWTAAVSAGELGDIVCLGDMGEHFTTALNADLLLDWDDVDLTPYENINASLGNAMKKVADFAAEAGHEGNYGFSYAVAMEDGAWAELTDPTYALQVRFDAWEKAGKPALTTLEDLPTFLKALQDAVPASASGEKVYAYGGFPDWEDCVMKFTWDLMTFYGYQEYDFMGVNYDTRDVVNPLEEGSLYYRALKVNNQLYREGLFDPESTSQNFDTYSQKLSSGRYLVALWGWIIGNYNSAEKAANKDGFVTFLIEDSAPAMQTLSTSGSNRMWALGANTEYADRALEIIDWLCSEEGMIVQNYGPKGLTWDYGEDGVPYMTDFGWQCQEDKQNTQMPTEYGGGTFQDGESKINHETIKLEQMIPGKTYSFSYKGWPCYAEHYATELSKAWSEEYAGGATSGVDLYRKTGKASVQSPAAIAYSKASLSEEGQQKRAQFAPIMKEYSWKCVYSADDAEFDANWKYMVETCKSYGYDDVVAEKLADIQNCFAYMDAND
ncbi:MAG: hypothetical protein IJ662_04755 [Clostridia bacterium]|nr:hypothetical protein [Clostridia bacterium]